MTFTAYDTGTAGFNIAVAVGKMMKDKYGTDVRVLPAGNDVARLAPLRAKRAARSRRWAPAAISRRKACSSSAPRNGARRPLQLVLSVRRLQRRLARRRQGYRRHRDQGPQGQARRLRGRLAGAEPERARDPGLRRSQAERRQDRRVLELRRDVEGHGQQRRRRRLRLHHHRPGQGGRDLAARHRLAAAARTATRPAGSA